MTPLAHAPEACPPAWRVIAASVAGSAHLRRRLPCQDACYWRRAGEILVAAVADGAGSASHSALGAFLATRTAVTRFCPPLEPGAPDIDAAWKTALCKAVEAAQRAVDSEASARGLRGCDLASTLLLAVCSPALTAVAQIGDGAAVAADTAGRLMALTRPMQGEYANETVFLTGRQALDVMQLTVQCGPYTHLALFSDGLQLLALTMPGEQPHAPFFTPFFRYMAHTPDEGEGKNRLTRFLRSPRVQARTDDDLTLLLAAREIHTHATATAPHATMGNL